VRPFSGVLRERDVPGKKSIEAADARQHFSDQIDNIAKRIAGGGRLN